MKKFFIITSIISSSLFALNLNTASVQELEKIKGFDKSTISNVKNNVIAKKYRGKNLKIKKKNLNEKKSENTKKIKAKTSRLNNNKLQLKKQNLKKKRLEKKAEIKK